MLRFAIATLTVLFFVGPVVWARLSKRGHVSACCAPVEASMDKRMASIDGEQAGERRAVP